jgi:hypothetical protein
MTLRRLLRDRLAPILVLLVPVVFLAAAVAITPEREIWVVLASFPTPDPPPLAPLPISPHGALVSASERALAAVFVGLASVAVVVAFLALALLQRGAAATRRLVLDGYRPWEVLAARLAALACVDAAVTLVVGALLPLFLSASRPAVLLAGLALGGLVFAGFGLLVAALFRSELVGILCVVLLANVDPGWLQNPAAFADAPWKAGIRLLPAHLPMQVALAGAFTDLPVGSQAAGSLGYAGLLVAAAAAVFTARSRSRRPSGGSRSLAAPPG